MRHGVRWAALGCLAALALGASGCGDDTTPIPLGLSLYGPDEDGQRPLLSFPNEVRPLVDELVITAYQGTEIIGESQSVDIGEGEVRLPKLPLGDDLWISIEAIGDVPSCADTCALAMNGVCEDGRADSASSACLPGTDCTDCNILDTDLRRTFASGASPRFSFDGKSEPVDLSIPMLAASAFTPAFRFDPEQSLSVDLVYELPNQTRAAAAVATLPESGGVLLIGGAAMGAPGGGVLGSGISSLRDTIEFYNPTTGTFLTVFREGADGFDANTNALRLPEPLAFATATAIDESTVVVAGGLQLTPVGDDFLAEANADIYVIQLTGNAEGRIERVPISSPDIPRPRMLHTATLLPDGRVVLAGGAGGPWDAPFFQEAIETIELVDGEVVRTDTNVTLQVPRAGHTATYFAQDGHGILLAGGKLGEAMSPASEVLFVDGTSFATETMSAGNGDQDLVVPRFGHGAARFSCPGSSDEYVAIIGGYTQASGPSPLEGSAPTPVIEVYDPSARFTGTETYRFVQNGAQLAQARAFATVVGLELSADVLVAGGFDANGNVLSTSERFFNDWSPCETLSGPGAVSGFGAPRAHASAAVLPSRALLITGGTDGGASLESSVFYNPNDYGLVRQFY